MTVKYLHRAKGDHFVMCDLRCGTTMTRGYIEARAAKVGILVELVDMRDFTTELWEVISVGDKTVDKKVLKDIEESYRGHRKVTDI